MNTLALSTESTNVFLTVLGATIPVGPYQIGYLELIGVLIGFAGAILGMRRSMLTWPVGAIANIILFFVYTGVVFGLDDGRSPAFGQAGRQVFFLIMAAFGWWQWSAARRAVAATGVTPKAAITPRWATPRERLQIVGAWAVGTVVAFLAFTQIGYFWPAPTWFLWADAWIFVGSLIATYAMARGWNEFWLCWIAVDLVGIPTLWNGRYYPTAVLYAAYGAFVIYGLTQWVKASKAEAPQVEEVAAAR